MTRLQLGMLTFVYALWSIYCIVVITLQVSLAVDLATGLRSEHPEFAADNVTSILGTGKAPFAIGVSLICIPALVMSVVYAYSRVPRRNGA